VTPTKARTTPETHAPSARRLDPLSALAVAHGTDKFGSHFYTPHYNRYFEVLRQRPVTLLEAGIGGYDDPGAGGESLAMWRDYFPHGRIVGIDIVAKRLDLGPRVTTRQGSMSDPAFIAALGAEFGPFDIIIDDGSHISRDTIRFLDIAFPLLVDGGYFAIEDTQTSYWAAFGGSLAANAATTMNLVKQLVDEVDHAERDLVAGAPPPHRFAATIRAIHRFHNLVLIEKGDNTEASNLGPRAATDPASRAALAEYVRVLEAGDGTIGTVIACARLLVAAGERDAALQRLEDALRRHPDSSRLRLLAARTAHGSGDVGRTVLHLRELRAADGTDLEALMLIAGSAALRGNSPAAAERAEQRAATAGGDPRTLIQAARVLEALRMRDRALHWLNVARGRLGPHDGAAAHDLVDAFRRLGSIHQALAIQDAIDNDTLLPADAVRRGALLRAAGRHEEAVDILTAATGLDWYQPRAHSERSRALAALGRDAEAMEAAKAFLASSRHGRRVSIAS
jgi:tetratricopeptide (TPR) repeat protein